MTAATRAALGPRRWPLLALALTMAVTLLHLWLLDRHWPERLGAGAADAAPKRIEVEFVRELAITPPPATAPAPPRPAPRLATMAPWPAASAPAAQGPLAVPEPEPVPALAAVTEPLPPVPVWSSLGAAPAASAAAAFEWPPSTRLSYTLSGDYRGPVQGQAEVEWLRSGNRYQVRMDVSVGPAFAPLFSRRISSEGEITDSGLQPRRYDEETRVALREPRRLTIWLDADRVRLPGGTELARPAGVQDSASQFVQMTWLFTTQPLRLQAGLMVELPLALPRRLEPWLYDVGKTETLVTPAGAVEAVHVKPRREAGAGGELTAEFWVAPSLQYLPVRIVVRQDAQSYVDLLIERLPQQAEPGR